MSYRAIFIVTAEMPHRLAVSGWGALGAHRLQPYGIDQQVAAVHTIAVALVQQVRCGR